MPIRWLSISQDILVLSFDTSFNYSNEKFIDTKYINMNLGKLAYSQTGILEK